MSDMDRELDRLLTDLRDEELPESALAATRSGVHARIRAGKRQRAAWTWVSLAAAAAVVWFAAVVVRVRPVEQLPVVALRAPQVPEAEFQRGVDVGGPKVPRGLKSAPQRAAGLKLRAALKGRPIERGDLGTEKTEFIRIMTDDPNVVILWALNSKGETR